ncbi:MAG: NAD(P)/FAD-dependent oxidoreductase [Pseudomonadota bacterium]
MRFDTDVVVVGAGAAGLSAAKELQAHGLECVVVEGAPRIGGRACSREIAPGVWFDLGCGFLHQGKTNPFVPIAEALGIELNHGHSDLLSKLRGFRHGRALEGEDAAEFERFFFACETELAASVARGEDRAIVELVDQDTAFFPPYASLLAAVNSLDVDDVSAADYIGFAQSEEGEKSDIPVPKGYGNLVKAWGGDVAVTLDCAAERIDWSGPGTSVETVKGRLRSRVALVTVSTGVLAADSIRFSPALPDWKVDAYLALPCGTVNKTCLHFDRDIFGPDGPGLYTTWGTTGPAALFEANVNATNTATVFTSGRHGTWLEQQGQAAAEAFALDSVASVFGNAIRKQVTACLTTAWASEPWTRGAYSCARPAQAKQRQALARPIDDLLFFAGEATIQGANATCHGAYLSGIRAAQEIATSLDR